MPFYRLSHKIFKIFARILKKGTLLAIFNIEFYSQKGIMMTPQKARLYVIGLVMGLGVATSLIGGEGDMVSPSSLSPTPNSEYIAPQIEKSSALVDSTPADSTPDSTLNKAQLPILELPLESMQTTPQPEEITPPKALTPQAQASYNANAQPSRELQKHIMRGLMGSLALL